MQHERSHGDMLAEVLGSRAPWGGAPRDDAFWQTVTHEAERRGLCGLVLEHATAAGLDLPHEPAARLRHGAARVAAEQLNMTHELARLLAAFNKADVPVMLLKGAALIQTSYAEPGLRPMSDLDLLVRPAHVDAAFDILEGAGCRRGAELVRDDFFPCFYYETEWLTDSPRPVRIDLHARALRPLRISRTMPDDALWQGSKKIDIDGVAAWIPSPEAMFIHLCAHAAYHGCAHLIWLYDLRRFVDQHNGDMDWPLVLRLCRRWRLSLPVRAAIKRCRDVVGNPCPSEVIEQLAAHRVSWRDRLVLWQTPSDAERPLLHVFVNAISTPDIRFALRYVAACLTPSRAHLAAVYPWRHWGWPVCAQLWRIVRAPVRILSFALPTRRTATTHPTPA